jgi:EAL domain-containing protein (putative c-di-GMP-specific phosphodiesterase class I)
MVTAIDLYMLDVVCRDLRRWLDDGIEPVCVSVNYSQSDFYRETLVKDTLDILQKYDIDGKYLEIEITESSFYENLSALQEFIRAMHENGVKVSLDDFGTGYSSLNMLKSLDLDTIKLDKSFFENLNSKDEKDRVVLRKVADMINELQKTAVSEGVEDAEQIDFARQIGCDIVQGYFFDKPMSCNDFTARLLDRHYDLQQDG